jgi:3D (Asp-Asp-Asp) domain-containing protein
MKKTVLFATLFFLILTVSLEIRGGLLTGLTSSRFECQTSAKEGGKTEEDLAVTVTAYSPTEEECDEDPYTTAYQKPVKEGTIAISRDLEEEFGWRLGDRIHIKGLGVFEVWDRMHPKWKKRVDVFFHDTEKAVSFGVRQAKATKVERLQRQGV